MRDLFKVLKEINKNSNISQRGISSSCDISLGKVNSMIEELESEGLITKESLGRGQKYEITLKGLELLEKELMENKELHIELHTEKQAKVKKAVILAAGKNSNFDVPVANLEVDGKLMIHRTIEILEKNGIEDIIVVTGYKSELVKESLKNMNVTLVENPNFKWTGTMASLAAAAEFIDDDFVLIESDIVVEELGIKEIIKYPVRDCVLITGESGSGDEAFVEIRDNIIYKISKDITQLNRIDGEMIGISKISCDFFNKMLEFYKDNKNPYMNYEYMMLDISRTYALGYVKVDRLLWHEIDNKKHFNYVVNKLLRKIEKKEKSALIQNLKGIASDCLKIDMDRIKEIAPIGGLTNKNYKVQVDEEFFVLRVPGTGTEEMISRADEIRNAAYANEVGVDAELVYFNEETGVKISRFIENAETLTPDAAKKHYNMTKVCNILRKLHNCNKIMENEFDIYGKIEKYEKLAKAANGKFFDDYEEVKSKVYELKDLMEQLDAELTPCHNDTLADNFIKSGEDKMYLIDWEYAGMNDPMWDLAAHSVESEFNDDEEELLLRTYFQGNVERKYKKRVLINKIYQDFLWSTWTIIKEAKGDDFGTYGIDRYNRAKRNLDIILKGEA
ncbi:MAG: phosphotransferase [Clostridium sp.]|nr:phosphotransferase [Clostridium sp.]MDU7084367.1 phosphotransferase [Clostridium sp.]